MGKAFLLDPELREKRYQIAKETEKHGFVICPSCGDDFKKSRKAQAFCSNFCKIKYWNRKQ